jgi:hypothetical protein
MLGSRQEQQGGDASVNIQGRDISFGLSYSDARQVAIDVFEANFHRLSQVAASTAKQRAEQLLDDYLQKLAAENIQEVPEAQNPDFQYALFTAQREYARTGRQETGELLVQLLVDRTRATDHNLVQIVLNESLAVAPKLTPGQLDVLSLVFVLRYTKNFTVVSPDTLGTYLDQYILPFADSLPVKHSAYQHLDFTSCANIEVTQIFVEEILLRHYGALFSKGFSEQDIADAGMIFGQVAPLLLPCFNDMAWWQSRAWMTRCSIESRPITRWPPTLLRASRASSPPSKWIR